MIVVVGGGSGDEVKNTIIWKSYLSMYMIYVYVNIYRKRENKKVSMFYFPLLSHITY